MNEEVTFTNETNITVDINIKDLKVGSLIRSFGKIQVCLHGKLITEFDGKAYTNAKEWVQESLSKNSVYELVNKMRNDDDLFVIIRNYDKLGQNIVS